MSETKPVTTTPGTAASALTCRDGSRPTIQNSASGTLAWTRGSTSRAKKHAASAFGGWAIIPVNRIRAGRSRMLGIGAK
jgi:hypothetical protein